MKKSLLVLFLFFLFVSPGFGEEASLPGIKIGMSKARFNKIYPKAKTRTYRTEARDEWLTFTHPKGNDIVTFHFQENKLLDWKLNDRKEATREYLAEFCSGTIREGFPKIYGAISHVLTHMPTDSFIKATDRQQPVLFTEFFDSGTAQFASSSEIISLPDDVPAFQNGFTLIKLSTGLEQTANPQAIEGIVAHELAHRVLEHIRKGNINCEAEREANRLIKEWGFTESYQEASKAFGHEAHGDGPNPCAASTVDQNKNSNP